MIKALLLIVSALTLVLAATITTTETQPCKYKDQLWGSQDGKKFYYCLDDIPVEQSCPADRFFVKNETVCGCVPLNLVNPNCVYARSVEPEPCEGENLKQPQPSKEPTNYYVCPAPGATPIKLTCENGKAFVKQEGYMGCFDWTDWRQIRKCPE